MLIVSGGSRGIELAIGVAAARRGANVVLLVKTDVTHPRLSGTVRSASAEIEAADGQALAVVGDIRDEASIARAVERFTALARERTGNACLDVKVLDAAGASDLSSCGYDEFNDDIVVDRPHQEQLDKDFRTRTSRYHLGQPSEPEET